MGLVDKRITSNTGKYQHYNLNDQEIFEDLIHYIQKDFLQSGLNKMDIKEQSIQELDELLNYQLKNIKAIFQKDLLNLVAIIESQKKSNIGIIPDNSLRDVLANINVSFVSSYIQTLDTLQNKQSMLSSRKNLAQQFILIFEYLHYYILELINDYHNNSEDNKLKYELTLRNGYITEFYPYLNNNCPVEAPVFRLLLFYFFNQLQLQHFNNNINKLNDFFEESQKLISGVGIKEYINLDQIKKKFDIKM
jgi:hypothetical protein